MSATVTTTAPAAVLPDYRHRTYDLKTPEEHMKMYDEWASTYNDDVMGNTTLYVGPKTTVEAVQSANGNLHGEVLDAGCGTGLCGVALALAGAKTIDGIDVSPGMLKLAGKTNTYRDLIPADMQKPLDTPSDKYDVVTCVGTFTTGHVRADPALGELVRVLKKGGVLAATVYEDIWKSEGFEAEVEKLGNSGKVDVISTEVTEYRRAENAMARMVVLRKR
ncbi:Williams-Beuren syndrome chromosomal region 27 [Lecanosticta acicola]|uniref:Williams-Beuren syndrome chromosomal region 27 n=1 Tax=Lecanosticta acicola TaxID=111012 RepID=A0AAI8Z4N8_9PEZI|nr:Williams-Beuren syndrome chromosomal region 27 [Lecanosticta acicola]